jgi:hypothetical protein
MRPKLHLTLILAALFVPLSISRGDDTLPQKYLAAYVKIHDAEILEKNSDYAGSLKGFEDAYASFADIRKADPDWETALVGHRMDDCKVTIQRLQNEIGFEAAKARQTATAGTPYSPPPISTTNTPPANLFLTTGTPHQKQNYEWRTGIPADQFYIGKGSKGSNVWNLKWPQGTKGDDSPDWRNGYAAGSHASYFNPFYVALPFNDLTSPDKAKQYLPPSWQRTSKDGAPVSVCQNRWVEIKAEDGSGHVCYAQWEDVGPLGSDNAEYVFGHARPDAGGHAGIALSPAVADYLGFNDPQTPFPVRWRFADPEDIPPGQWLKLDEQAVIYTAMHESKDTAPTSAPGKAAVPISPSATPPPKTASASP